MSTGRSTTVRDRDRRAIARTKPPCGICEQEIDYSLPHTDPMSYVVDHVIPLAKGGEDALPNKQAAHRQPGLQPVEVRQARRKDRSADVRHDALVVRVGGAPLGARLPPLPA